MLTYVLLSAIAVSAAITSVVFLAKTRSLKRKLHAEKFRGITLHREAGRHQKRATQLEADQKFLVRFLKEFPHVAHQLHEGMGGRQIPTLLLSLVVRIFQPARALVVVRRRAAGGDSERRHRFVVAAVAPEGGLVEPGTEITLGEGPIGFAIEVQRVMDRRDFAAQPADVRSALKARGLPGFSPDVVAPLVSSEQTVGAIAVQGVNCGSIDVKDVLRVIAQTGALAVRSLERLTEMKATASLDGLTRIFNKRYLTQRLAEQVRTAVERQQSLAVFMFDVDHFKHYNDRNGHAAGDELLRRLARLVQANVRQDSLFGRVGGEEFVVVLPGADKAQGLAAAENLCQLISEHPFEFAAGQPLHRVSISGGVAACPEDTTDSGALLRFADEALYAAKHAGRNRVMGYVTHYLGDAAQEPVEPADYEVSDEAERSDRLKGEEAALRTLEVDRALRPEDSSPLKPH